jgi:hypothetical protein
LPYFSFVAQIRPGAGSVIDRPMTGCAVEGWTISIGSGLGRANSKINVEFHGSGKLTEPSVSLTLTINGVDYVTSKNIVSFETSWKNNIRMDAGFYPGSGFQTSGDATTGAIRGRLEFGNRAGALKFVVRFDHNSTELTLDTNNSLEDVNKANASISSMNTGLSSMEQAARKAARGASAGIDGLTISMVKGSAAGNLLADSIKKALDWAKEWTFGAAQHAAHKDKMSLSMAALAKAHGVSAEASNRAVEAVKKVGSGTQDAIHAVDLLMVADMNLSKAEGLAKVAKDGAAMENITPGKALEKLLMATELGAPHGLRIVGIVVDLDR